ncbi:MAG: maleate cis-trans isomerase family protein, partial [Hyphomicrobiaceae bacterium]
KPSVIAYGCTASSIVQGVDYDEELRQEITQTYGKPATTAAHAITTAVAKFGGKSVSIVSPYPAEVDKAEHRYFTDAGLDVLGGAFLGISDGFELASPQPKALFELGLKGCDDKSDVLIMSCLNTRSHSVISELEQTLDKPVVTSTQATLWHALRLAGIDDKIPGLGRLLTEH